jgi:dipeptide/tripeptide permease
MSDIRLIMVGAVIMFAGFMIGGMTNSTYSQFAVQQENFDQCFDYSSGVAVHVKCAEKSQDYMLYLGLSFVLLGIGGVVIFKGIRGKWDHDVKDSEMLGPKNP